MPGASSVGPFPPLHHSLHQYGQHAAPPGLQSYALASGMDLGGTPYPPGGPRPGEVLETQASDAEDELGPAIRQDHFHFQAVCAMQMAIFGACIVFSDVSVLFQ